MHQRTRPRRAAAIIAAVLVGGLALGNPSALAEPDVAPPPAPIDPAAVPARAAATRPICISAAAEPVPLSATTGSARAAAG